jgi:regulation of enolase protein 1 (concanavalin A-like superfamily)
MSDALDLPGLPFSTTPSHPEVWRLGDDATVIADAPGHTDLYVNPGGSGSTDAASLLNAATLLGLPPTGDFQLSARVSVDFAARFDAGVLLIWLDDTHWAKLCFELSPAGDPMVVSVVTLGLSDDANSFVVPERSVWLRVSRLGRVYAYHASFDGEDWALVRVFSLGDAVHEHRIGLEAQSPTGEGCTVRFEELRFVQERLVDLRDGS